MPREIPSALPSVRNFKNAEKDVKRVAGEVKTASWALKQLGALLQQDEAIKRTKPGAISEASTALDQCSEAFAEVQIILPAAGSDSTASISAATRFKWATRKSKITSSTKDSATDQMDTRFQLETLIKSKNEAVRRYEELVKSLNQTRLDEYTLDDSGLDLGSQKSNVGVNLMALPSNHAPAAQGNTNVTSTAPDKKTDDKPCENHDFAKGLTEALADCHKAASGLSECLEMVHIQWRAVQKYDGDDIWKNYRLTHKAMRALEVVQAASPRVTPSLAPAHLQAPQQQAQEQIKPNEQQTVQAIVPNLSLSQVQGQEKASRSARTPLLAVASPKDRKKLTEPPEMVMRSDSDDWPLSASSGPAPRSRPPSRSPSPAHGRDELPPFTRENDFGIQVAISERSPSNDNSKRVQKHTAPFPCHLCPKRFTRAYNLRSHLRTHTDERPFVCTVCGKAFARQHDRKRHEGLHSGEKNFVCKSNLQSGAVWGCGRRFARADALYRHVCSEAGRVCIKPLREEERASRRQSVEEENATTQPNPRTGGFKVETGVSGVEEASPRTDHELPAALLRQYPALATVAENWLSMGAQHPHRTIPADTHSEYSDPDTSTSSGYHYYDSDLSPLNSPYVPSAGDLALVDNASNSRQGKIDIPPLTQSDRDPEEAGDPVDALLRQWTTVQVC